MLKQPGTTMLRGMGQSVADGKISEQQCLAFATRKLNAIRTGERTPLSVAAPHAAGAGPCRQCLRRVAPSAWTGALLRRNLGRPRSRFGISRKNSRRRRRENRHDRST
jgi:hypothetical protein